METWTGAAALSLAAFATGWAIEIESGRLDPFALALVLGSIVLAALALARVRIPIVERTGERVALWIIGAGVVVELAAQFTRLPAVYLQPRPGLFVLHHELLAVAAVLTGAILAGGEWLKRLRFPLLIVVFAALGVWLLRASPRPYIDVFAWHLNAFHALSAHLNPYAITMPNIYHRTDWYAPGLATPMTVDVGYPYPPLTLLLNWLGQLIAGDYRFTNLAALVIVGAVPALFRNARIGLAAAALFLLTPRILFVLEQGWTEPLALGLLALTVLAAHRTPKALPFVFGLLLATKQYLVLAAPLALLLLPRPLSWRQVARFYVTAGLTAAVTILPFFLVGPGKFFASVVAFEGKQPFRADSLSVMAWLAHVGGPLLPEWLPFLLVLPVIALALWRGPRTPAGFAAGSALVFLVFFAFAKQAFANYYFFCTGALAIAAAATGARLAIENALPAVPLAQPGATPGRIPERGADRAERVAEEVRHVDG